MIEKKEKRKAFGEETEYLVLRMAHGEMTLAVPVDKADEVGMRWPISEEDVEDLFEVLAKRDVREPANWSRRFKNHQEKLKSGDVYQVAEVVRNLALRDQAKGLSAGEKSLYTKARNVLVSELAFALDVDEEAAMAKVDGALVWRSADESRPDCVDKAVGVSSKLFVDLSRRESFHVHAYVDGVAI